MAIEMTASHVRTMTEGEILERFGHQLEIEWQRRDVPERHKTMRAALGWSWGLLTEDERSVLAQVSVFAGGFFAEAAEAVCRSITPRGRLGVQPILEQLAAKSWLVTQEVKGRTRYRFLEVVREYAYEKLVESKGRMRPQAVRHRHAWYFLSLARKGRDETQRQALEEVERDNLRLARAWAQAERTAKIFGAMHFVWAVLSVVSIVAFISFIFFIAKRLPPTGSSANTPSALAQAGLMSTSGRDRTIKLWQVSDGKLLRSQRI